MCLVVNVFGMKEIFIYLFVSLFLVYGIGFVVLWIMREVLINMLLNDVNFDLF